MEKLLCIYVGYCFGMFQSAYILVRLFKKTDIRSIGTSNPGTANVYLNYGAGLAALTLLTDILKTVAAVLVCTVVFDGFVSTELIICYTSLGVAIGHEFPVWLRFHGGKGIAVALAFMLVLDWRILVVTLPFSGAVALLLKSVTAASYSIAAMMVLASASLGISLEGTAIILIQSLLITALHAVPKRAGKKLFVTASAASDKNG